ncbi:MAG: hypothetical protein Ct9H300mP8_03780 [Gammaproteobacteria bacterium]|nr:MAG: hypothetical protein Ct9H300mP8_03780 [Gammaproteobacteria bacterium]
MKEVRYVTDEAQYIALYAKPNFPVLGKRLGKRMKEYQALIEPMTADDITNFHDEKEISLGGERFMRKRFRCFVKRTRNKRDHRSIDINRSGLRSE